MPKIFYLILIATLATSGFCGHKHAAPYYPPIETSIGIVERTQGPSKVTHHKKVATPSINVPFVTTTATIIPPTPAIPVEGSNEIKNCPEGFVWRDRECAKVETMVPDTRCPEGFIFEGKTCVKYNAKVARCPNGHQHINGLCIIEREIEAELVCPEDFAFGPRNNECIRTVPLPSVPFCPGGLTRRGDYCMSRQVAMAQLVCPPHYVLQGNQCIMEEIYDCTPETPIRPEIPPSSSKHKKHLRMLGSKKHAVPTYIPPPPIVEAPILTKVQDVVVETTCRRTRTEEPRKICPHGSRLEGIHCIVEHQHPLSVREGGFREDFAIPIRRCPRGYVQAPFGRCFLTEEVKPKFFCPQHSVEIGHRCAIYAQPELVCPVDWELSAGMCTRTIIAPPIVEFTVTYVCTGDDCAHYHHNGCPGNDCPFHHHHKL